MALIPKIGSHPRSQALGLSAAIKVALKVTLAASQLKPAHPAARARAARPGRLSLSSVATPRVSCGAG